ncbi:F0F1 ATP synthase subunit I [Endozoicomonas sp. SCSIO W0465]|uniref:F0F1 ATP synthase subunit I n=1 Tax=Endozoicomonas sp. SCSIO W0465 TaxID=2918516 RepID=UPI00207612D2|nr:F0F1 ATP synthase subunit I [Endozoicomonas sp. SCSIO W0465]USE36247.1 F0F1 ATP synthase subunit I [Endozoicomonas sp. SCSIO W0465]
MSEAKAWKQQRATPSDDGAGFANRKFCRADHRKYLWLQPPPVHRVIVAQLVVSAALALMLLPLGSTFTLSSLLGGLCCSLPNAYFVWRAFRYRGARSAKLIVSSFYRGEAGKLVLTAVGFILVFTLVEPLEPLALFVTFTAVQAVSWFAPVLMARRQQAVP